MYGVLASGWTLTAYVAQILFENIRSVFITHQKYVAAYVLTATCISFSVCYYKGPPKNVRSKDLIKWGLQLLGLLAIFFSSEFIEATIGVIAACIVLYYFPSLFPSSIINWFFRMWRKKFPPKRQLLSKEEFDEQGRIETEKALNDLREYVKSPKCKEQWKLVKNLSQPTRFAAFVEGDEHLTRDETFNYDQTLQDIELSSDDDSSVDMEESIAVDENFVPIDKSKLKPLRNGNIQNFSRASQVSSTTTPNSSRLKTRQSATRSTFNTTFEISDDE